MGMESAFLPQSATILATSSGIASTPTTQAIAFPGVSPAVMGPVVPPPVALVVADSVPERELEETRWKALQLLRAARG